MFPQRQDLIDMIPDPSDMSPTKLLGGMVSTDTCNTARLTRQTLCDAIIQEGRDAGLVDNELNMYQGNCHQHLRNILVDAGSNHLSSKLTELLCDDLSIIPPHLCVTCNISHILRACDKEFGFTANYAKGHGSMFHSWLLTFRPGSLFVPVVRVLNGNRQQGNTARFQQETAATRREVRAERKASKREEAEGINGRLHECIIPSPAI